MYRKSSQILFSLLFVIGLLIFSHKEVQAQSCCAFSNDECPGNFVCVPEDPRGTGQPCNLTQGKPNFCVQPNSSHPDFQLPTYSEVGSTGGPVWIFNPDLLLQTFRGKPTQYSVSAVINEGLLIIFSFAGLLLFIYLLYGAFTMLSSLGNPEGLAGGQKIITRAIIGFLILFLSYLIVEAVELILGLTIL